MNDEAAGPDIAALYNRHFQRNQSFAVARLHDELLREIHTARERGVPTTLARHVPLAPVPYRAERFKLEEGDGHYRADQLIIGPSMTGISSTSNPSLSACIGIDKDSAQVLLHDLESEQHLMSVAFFDGMLVLPTDFNDRESTCGGGVFRAIPPHRQYTELFYDHTERQELCRLVRRVAESNGMSPAEHRQWLERETGNDPGSQFAAE